MNITLALLLMLFIHNKLIFSKQIPAEMLVSMVKWFIFIRPIRVVHNE